MNFEDNKFEAVAAGSSVENYLAAVVFRPLLQDTCTDTKQPRTIAGGHCAVDAPYYPTLFELLLVENQIRRFIVGQTRQWKRLNAVIISSPPWIILDYGSVVTLFLLLPWWLMMDIRLNFLPKISIEVSIEMGRSTFFNVLSNRISRSIRILGCWVILVVNLWLVFSLQELQNFCSLVCQLSLIILLSILFI